jgi:hypothetical protein
LDQRYNRHTNSDRYIRTGTIPCRYVSFYDTPACPNWKSGSGEGFGGTHFTLALVLLILGILQPIYGTLIHQAKLGVPFTGKKSLLRYGHPIVGVSDSMMKSGLSLTELAGYNRIGLYPGIYGIL